jgi:AcrR family transcriptional regulator
MTTAEAAAPSPKVRITKDPDVRREELLDIALDLCRSQGFDALRVEQVVQRAGVAKGTFYHYFASKDAVLEALVQRFGEGLFAQLSAAAGGADRPAVERLQAAMHAAQSFKTAQGDVPLAALLQREENLAMRHRIYRAWLADARRVLQPLISDGVADGSFDVADAAGATDIILLLWFDAGDRVWERAVEATSAEEFTEIMLSGSRSVTQAQERVLGVAPDTFAVRPNPEIVAMITELYHTLEGNQS